ncbi:MAG: class I SAM-dependent methyltransferase [Cyanobacteria bacterium J06555_13]
MNQPTHADIGLDISPGITVGVELERFEKVKNWKRYVGSILCPYLKGDVLEIGAGRGNNTEFLSIAQYSSWTFLEPDSVLYQVLAHRITALNNPLLRTHQGTIQDLSPHQRFDSILYIDVLEHIKEHQAEIASATLRLQRNGYLIVLSPAHQFLYSPFDQAVGHYRRYTKQSHTVQIK